MQKVQYDGFHFIGISVRTNNLNGAAGQDIPALWGKFMGEGIVQKIPNKVSEEVLCMYTDYVSDHNSDYTTILGCKVSSLENIPEGMVGKSIEGGNYEKVIAKGNLNQGVIFQAWNSIWQKDWDRKYAADFEIYGANAMNPEDAEVEILVGIV